MYELNCANVIPGSRRIIRAETQAGVVRRAIAQANALGIERISPAMMDTIRERTVEVDETNDRAA
ncbi:DUF1059 domain-containing protein [Jiella marina]|uniref:DUF1059 domain-containing protein n=1 Tax=Jiella sp. LLJ827 TaxID=2917712 RepID=UPI002100AAE5|nr:DUF1059 domain-containing protein [Jiella sp. LLJ827]MCQ0989671.1 DUF1059 domain-containing protein [Jiella sp. LLJ827]